MKLAIIASNILPIEKEVKKGTELFVYILVESLFRLKPEIDVTLFASGDSKVSVKLQSIAEKASFLDEKIGRINHKIFELALISKAFSQQNNFDLFHVNIGNGEIVLPFAFFVKRPILITLHGSGGRAFYPKYYSFFSSLNNVFFVSVSDNQKKFFPNLPFVKTIYNGVDSSFFRFCEKGGDFILWAGRGVPEKGIEKVIEVAKKTKKPVKIFAIRKENYLSWITRLKEKIEEEKNRGEWFGEFNFEITQKNLVSQYQSAKLFLNPLQWEEPFGMVMIEAMACGTPVVAFAKGSVPEIVKDGETGFVVNPSDDDIRGDWVIKKTGIEGIGEAVERIYSMPKDQYLQMRRNCRVHVEKNFTIERMVEDYVKVYQQVIRNV